jgi:hypothetical protein
MPRLSMLHYLSSSGSGTKYGVYATGENMNYFSGLVGIGTSPATTLDVANSTIVTTSRFTNTFSSGITENGCIWLGILAPELVLISAGAFEAYWKHWNQLWRFMVLPHGNSGSQSSNLW